MSVDFTGTSLHGTLVARCPTPELFDQDTIFLFLVIPESQSLPALLL